MTELSWCFPEKSKKTHGIDNGGIEQFNDTPLKSMAREICQNSLDATKDSSIPVEVDFKLFNIHVNDIPDVATYKDALIRGQNFWKQQNNPKANEFYNKAVNAVNSEFMPVLRISDHNTTGLTDSDKLDNLQARWTSLVMSEGASPKEGDGGGSFGLGKFSSFANSDVRTVFYSTVDMYQKEASEGLAIHAAFRDKDGDLNTGEGYCGDNSNPVYKRFGFDPNYIRKISDPGTDVYILAFPKNDDWKKEIIVSILDGFLVAIFKGLLVVNVDGVEINKKSLPDIMKEYGQYSRENAEDYYAVLTDEEHSWIDYPNYSDKGSLHIKLLIKQGLQRNVAMVRRTGMKISDKNGISGQISFAGVMYIDGIEINKYLTSLENPAHVKWCVSRDKEDPKRAEKFLIGLTRIIKDELNKLISNEHVDFVDPHITGLEDIKAHQGDMHNDEQYIDSLNDKGMLLEVHTRESTYNSISKKDDNNLTSGQGEEPGEGGNDQGGDNGGGSGGHGGGHGGEGNNSGEEKGSHDGADQGDKQKFVEKNIKLKRRTVMVRDSLNGLYTIKLTFSDSAENGVISLNASGEDNSYEMSVSSINIDGQPDVVYKNGKISNVVIQKDVPIIIQLRIDSSDMTSFEVKGYASETK